MSSDMQLQLPIIDISPYLPSISSTAAARKDVATALHLACRDVGFFYLKVSSFIDDDEMRELLELGREFFHRPAEEKEAIGLDKSDSVRGYQKLHQNVTQGKADHHEGLDLYAPNPYPARDRDHPSPDQPNGHVRPLEGENLWPFHPVDLRHKLEGWVEKMKVLGEAVMHAMADGLGCTEEEWEGLRGMVDDSFWVMRVIGYPPLPDGTEGISCGEHKDYGCLTFLLADPIPGSLQARPAPAPTSSSTPGSGSKIEWLNADPQPGCLVVNIGEMWGIWTGGLYPATLHRVIHRSPTYRVSIPFFFEPNFDARVKLLDAARRRLEEDKRTVETVSEEVVYGEFLLEKVGGNFKY